MKIQYPIIINKYIAQSNIASRKESDRLLRAGKIFINGKLAEPGQLVYEADEVKVQADKKLHYFAYNKPRGVVSSCAQGEEENITDVLDLPKGVVPIGRLDKQSEGLIILTNDGRITDKLLNPDRYHEKEYVVEVSQQISSRQLSNLANGILLDDGYRTKPAMVRKDGIKKFSIILTEGKNRQIRRMAEQVGLRVVSLKRVRIMHVHLGDLSVGQYRELKSDEIKILVG
ncbi:MAG: pseudouridine synthase [bacterium]